MRYYSHPPRNDLGFPGSGEVGSSRKEVWLCERITLIDMGLAMQSISSYFNKEIININNKVIVIDTTSYTILTPFSHMWL